MATQRINLQLGERFDEYIAAVREVWRSNPGPELALQVRSLMERLLTTAGPDEPWVAGLVRDRVAGRELYRDPEFGFIQMGHFHPAGHSNSPHDHGPCWVVYGVYSGEVEITTYRRTDRGSEPGRASLEVIERQRLTPGVARPYLASEIHSTRAISPAGSVVLRFLSADLDRVVRNRYDLATGTVVTVTGR